MVNFYTQYADGTFPKVQKDIRFNMPNVTLPGFIFNKIIKVYFHPRIFIRIEGHAN